MPMYSTLNALKGYVAGNRHDEDLCESEVSTTSAESSLEATTKEIEQLDECLVLGSNQVSQAPFQDENYLPDTPNIPSKPRLNSHQSINEEKIISDATMIGDNILGPCEIAFLPECIRFSFKFSSNSSKYLTSAQNQRWRVYIEYWALTEFSTFRNSNTSEYHIMIFQGQELTSLNSRFEQMSEEGKIINDHSDTIEILDVDDLGSERKTKRAKTTDSYLLSLFGAYEHNGTLSCPRIIFYFHDEMSIAKCRSSTSLHTKLEEIHRRTPTSEAWNLIKRLNEGFKPRPTPKSKKFNGETNIKEFFDNAHSGGSTSSSTSRSPTYKPTSKEPLKHQTGSSKTLSNALEKSNQVVTVYPFPEYMKNSKGQVSITEGDIIRLGPGEFLNDNIIDFYLKFLWRQLPDSSKEHVHFFSTHFFTQLTKKTPNSPQDEFEGPMENKDSDKSNREKIMLQKQYENVRRWTLGMNLFEYNYVFIPINDSMHWSLAVICNPGSLLSRAEIISDSDDPYIKRKRPDSASRPSSPEVLIGELENLIEGSKQPCILLLDSLGFHGKRRVMKTIWGYLECAWRDRYKEERKFNQLTCPHLVPKVPQQENGWDCGVFILLYTLRIIRERLNGIDGGDIQENLASCFTLTTFGENDVIEFRDYLVQLIHSLKVLSLTGRSDDNIEEELPTFKFLSQ